MAKAEVGTPKYVANQMKARGLQKLKWFCQVCEKQCRDENGFKCHTQSESHQRKVLTLAGDNGAKARKAIEGYSSQFLRDFVSLLRSSHGEKPINVNRFYNEYISNKTHLHLNATKWHSVNQLVQYLGTEGICRVAEDTSASSDSFGVSSLTIAWIDNSPEAMRRREALKKKSNIERGDELVAQRILESQVKAASKDAKDTNHNIEESTLKREPTKSLSFAIKTPQVPRPMSLKKNNVFKVKK